jgi:hypothetical protein
MFSHVGRLVQAGQNALDLIHVRRRQPAVIVVFVEPFKPPVLKRLDHRIIVT